MQKDNIVLT